MFKQFLAASIIILGSLGLSSAQDKTFDSELSGLRKNVIAMCAQLQAGQPKESQEQLLKDIDTIIGGWEGITATYKNTPPKEYAKDPAWKSYFDEALDNFQIMRQKTEANNYKRAMQFCGFNCALFIKIHQVNGRSTLTDKLFMLRQNVRSAVAMAKAENWAGAQEIIKECAAQLQGIKKIPNPSVVDKTEYNADISQIEQAYGKMRDIIAKKDAQGIDKQLKSFLSDFGKIYMKYI
jgi:hypothetical protein